MLDNQVAINVSIAIQAKGTDRGESVPIFWWDDNYRFGGVDFDDPTTNVHDVAP